MNENVQENYETVGENISSGNGVSGNVVDVSGNGGSSVSSGNNGQVEYADTSGNGDFTGNAENSVSDGNYNLYTATSADIDYSPQMAELTQGVNALNAIVTLLFFFLLMAWAEKKINTVVRRFSEKKR